MAEVRRQAAEVVRRTFVAVLDREVDEAGLAYYTKRVLDGLSAAELKAHLEASEEFQLKQARHARNLPNLMEIAPERYAKAVADDGVEVDVYVARTVDDIDWIDRQIAATGYYETPGVWSFGIDLDKRLMAELVGLLEPESVVEVGCSSGAVLHCLAESGVSVTGIDISELARSKATELVRDRILIGEIGALDIGRRFDVGLGLDVFEHVHPSKLDDFITALVGLIRPGGYLVANVPAFGRDRVFGEVFPMFLPEWRRSAAAGRPFDLLQVDEDGYPMHGHLTWATSPWWVARFEAAGLQRLAALERPLHRLYDDHFRRSSPARRAFYVFGRSASRRAVRALARRMRRRSSAVLDAFERELAVPDP